MCENTFLHIGLFLWSSATLKSFNNLFHTWSMKWITLCVKDNLSGLCICDTGFCCIKGHYKDVTIRSDSFTCCFNSINSTKCFIIIFTIYHIDIFVLFQHRLHNFLSFCLCKFTGLLCKKIPAICFHCFIQSFCTSNLSRCTNGTLNINNVNLINFLCILICFQPSTRFLTFQFKIRANPCSIQTVI